MSAFLLAQYTTDWLPLLQPTDYRLHDDTFITPTEYEEYLTDILWPRSQGFNATPFNSSVGLWDAESQWYNWPSRKDTGADGVLPRIFYMDPTNGKDCLRGGQAIALVNSTNTTPIKVCAYAHGLATGDRVSIAGHTGDTAANGVWTVVVLDEYYFTLTGSVGNGTGGATGNMFKRPLESSTNTNPIQITQTAHGLINGDRVNITGHLLNLPANGTWTITKIDANTFSIPVAGTAIGANTGIIYNKPIESSTNTNPIQITSTAHGLTTGEVITITAHLVNTAAVGTWTVTVIDANTFSIDVKGNGVGGATGYYLSYGGATWADAWKTALYGATAARLLAGDTIRIAKSPVPTSIGTAQWTSTTTAKGALPATVAITSSASASTKPITSSTNATPIKIVKVAHGFSNGDTVSICDHATNTNANGVWVIVWVDADSFTLTGSVGNGVGGATGNVTRVGETITITKVGHGFVNGDVVNIQGHTGNTAANGAWVVANAAADTFDLSGSAGNGTGGAVGTIQKCVNRVVQLTGGVRTLDIDQVLDNANAGTERLTGVNSATVTSNILSRVSGALPINTLITLPAVPAASTLYAYKKISGAGINYSAYQNISFWIRVSISVPDVRYLTLCLCSNADGTGIVDTFVIPYLITLNYWTCLTLPKSGGGNLGASIKSWAIYSGTVAPTAATTIRICNIVATKTGDLDLNSLISKTTTEQGGTEGWYAIQSISKDGTLLSLDWGTESLPMIPRGYYGTTEPVITYQRQSHKTYMDLVQTYPLMANYGLKTGTCPAWIYYRGGWDTSTGLQTGETFYDGSNGYGAGFYTNSMSYLFFEYLSFCRFNVGYEPYGGSGNGCVANITNVTCNSYGIYVTNTAIRHTVTVLNANCNVSCGFYVSSYDVSFGVFTVLNANGNGGGVYTYSRCYANIFYVTNVCNNNVCGCLSYPQNLNIIGTQQIVNITNALYNGTYGVQWNNQNQVLNVINANYNDYGILIVAAFDYSCNNVVTVTNANYNTTCGIGIGLGCFKNIITVAGTVNNNGYGVYFNQCYNNLIRNLSASDNVTAQIYTNAGANYLERAILGAGVEVAGYTIGNSDVRLFSQFHGGGVYSRIYTDYGQINSLDTDRPGGTGKMWKMAVTAGTYPYNRSVGYPLTLSIAKIAVNANALVTVTTWMRKDDDLKIDCGLWCKGGQLLGVASDVKKYKNNDTAWENLSISFTPTEAGVIEILAFAEYRIAPANAYVGEMTITQA